MNSRLFINGDVSMNSRLFVRSDVSMNGRLFVSNDVSMNGNLYTIGRTILQGDVSLNSRLFVYGDVSMNSRLFVTSDVSFGSRLFVGGNVSMSSNLFVTGDLSLNDDIYVFRNTIQQGDVSMNSRLFINGDVSMNSRLFVRSDVSMNGRLFVSNDVSMNANLFVNNALSVNNYLNIGNRDGYVNQYPLDVSGTVNIRGTVNPISLIDGSTLYTNTPALDFSNNMTTIFKQTTIGGTGYQVAMSATGQYQYATNGTAFVYMSYDHGSTWRQVATPGNMNGIGTSGTGQYVSGGQAGSGMLYRSTNYGSTWVTDANSSGYTLTTVAISATGQYQLVSWDGYNRTYPSSTYGVTWGGGTGGLNQARSVAMSATGQYQAATNNNGAAGAYTYSTNYGNTWTQGTATGTFVAMSATGQYQALCATSNYINISNNFGITWTQVGSSQTWTSVAISANGQYMVACGGGSIFTSLDYGNSWKQSITGISATSITMSSNAQYVTAISSTGGIIYTFTTPYSNLSVSNTAVFGGDVSMNARLFIGNDLFITGRLNVYEYTNRNIVYTNVTTTSYTLIVAEDMSLNGRLNVNYDASLNARLFVGSDVSMNGNLYNLGRTILQGDVSMNSRLFVFGNIGLGTNNPTYTLDVVGNTRINQASQSQFALALYNATNAVNTINFVPYLGLAAFNNITSANDSGIVWGNAQGSTTGGFVISPWANATTGLRIANNGNVSINTTTNTSTLNVTGTATVTGSATVTTSVSTPSLNSTSLELGAYATDAGPYIDFKNNTAYDYNARIQLTGGTSNAVNGTLTYTAGVHSFVSGNVTVGVNNASTSTTTGSLQVTGGAGISGNLYAANLYSSNGLFINSWSQPYITAGATQGTYIGWNYTNGGGETVFVNSKGTGGGGFNFYNMASGATSPGTAITTISGTGAISSSSMTLTGTTASTSAGSGTMILSGSGAGLGVAGNVYVGGNLYSTASSTLSGINYIDRIAELIANPSAGATSFDYSTGSVFNYSLTSSANITANFLNVNPSAVTNRTFVASLIISSGTYKGYVSAVTVSATGTTGASNTLYFNGGASAISVSSASVIVQTFAFVYTSSGSAPAFTLSNVASYQA